MIKDKKKQQHEYKICCDVKLIKINIWGSTISVQESNISHLRVLKI